LNQVTFKNNKKALSFVLWYQHTDSLGLVNCNSNLPAVVQDDVCDTVQFPEKINTDY
jgi:hypothetical protein